MTYLVERLAELRRHLDHLKEIRPRVGGREDLDLDRVVEALADLDPIEQFFDAVRTLAAEDGA